MSKSIEQYKDAMDSIRISESFYARTEALLKEGSAENYSSERIKSIKPSYGRKCIGLVLGAAACAALVTAIGKDRVTDESAISGGVVEEASAVTEVTAANETVYIDIEEDHMIYTISPSAEPEAAEVPKATSEAVTKKTEAEVRIGADTAETEITQTENVVPTNAVEETLVSEIDIAGLLNIDFSKSETELTSYLHSGLSADSDGGYTEGGVYVEAPAPSGMNFLILDERAAEDIVKMIADSLSSAPVIEGRENVHAEFVIDISDFVTEKTKFTVCLCIDKTICVTEYDGDESCNASYAVADPDFIEIEKYLFLKFGSLSQYEEFINA